MPKVLLGVESHKVTSPRELSVELIVESSRISPGVLTRVNLPRVELPGVELSGIELPRELLVELPGVELSGIELPRELLVELPGVLHYYYTTFHTLEQC